MFAEISEKIIIRNSGGGDVIILADIIRYLKILKMLFRRLDYGSCILEARRCEMTTMWRIKIESSFVIERRLFSRFGGLCILLGIL